MALIRALCSLGSRSGVLGSAPAATALPAAASALLVHSRFMSSNKLFVGGLAWETDEGTLRDAFSSFGEVEEAKVIFDRTTGRSRGFGFVSFSSEEAAQSALESMDGKFLGGRSIRVDFATQREPGSAPSGGFRRGGGGYGQGEGQSSRY